MDNRLGFISWSDSAPDRWNFQRQQKYSAQIIFELSKLSNFAEPRFKDLGEKLDERKLEVIRRQTQMLRQLHGLGLDAAIVLRLRRDGNRIRLYVIVRLVGDHQFSAKALDENADRVQGMFPKEYNFVRLIPERDQERWKHATNLTWARFVDELIKPEDDHRANTWPYFYTASLWQPQSTNDMEAVCRTLLRFDGDAMVEITLIPTKFASNEQNWLDGCVKLMRDALSGERLLSRGDGKVLKNFDPIPTLRSPLENYEELLKRYGQNRVFLYAFRMYASGNPFSITQAIAANATRSQPQIVSIDQNHPLFQYETKAGQYLDIAPEVRSPWWNKYKELTYRAQRFHRLADIDEISSFWRLPIPIQAGFPGFELDIGTDLTATPHLRHAKVHQINLGSFTDDQAKIQQPATFNREGLAKHGLVVGVPGSGKTTTMFNILSQLWSVPNGQDRIPFIVLEPAKTEYRALKELDIFKDNMLVFSLGDERISPFRFNPFEVLKGIPLESHISRLNACFTGAFNLFDPLPLLLDKAIRETYQAKGWFEDSVGGETGLVTPTLADLCRYAELVVMNSGYSDKLRDDFNAALIQRLESLRRGSKGRMLDTKESIPFDVLMQRPVIFELDALNEDEKSLLMMFILTFVYEYAKANRRSGSPLRHVLLVEEAHNLIGRGDTGGSEFRANPKDQSIRLFVRMLAEMRALGQSILIADQLPTALAPEAVKQTNLKILMRMTAIDDREEIGNTMDLGEAELKAVTRFKSGQAFVYLEEWDRVRQVQTPNFKDAHGVGEPPDDETLSAKMKVFESENQQLFMPFAECPIGCSVCNRRVRNQAERFVQPLAKPGKRHINNEVKGEGPWGTVCRVAKLKAMAEAVRLRESYSSVDPVFPFCAYVHLLHLAPDSFELCHSEISSCDCKQYGRDKIFSAMLEAGEKSSKHPI